MEVEPTYISAFTPEEAEEEVRAGRLVDVTPDTYSDCWRVKLADGSWWKVAGLEMEKLRGQLPVSNTRQVEVWRLEVNGEWCQSSRMESPPMRPDKEQVIHVLDGGSPLCRFTREEPRNWPEGHYWVPFAEDQGNAPVPSTRCKKCFEISGKLFYERFPKPSATIEWKEDELRPAKPAPANALGGWIACPKCNGGKAYQTGASYWTCHHCTHCWEPFLPGRVTATQVRQASQPQPAGPIAVPSSKNCPNCAGPMNYYASDDAWRCTRCGHVL